MSSKALIDKLVGLKPAGRSLQEIAKALGESVATVKDLLEAKPDMPAGSKLVDWQNHLGTKTYLILPPEAPAPRPEPRAFRYLAQPGGQAYQLVFIPDDLKDENGKPASFIELWPFSDVHWGHKKCDKKNFLGDMEEVRKRPNRYAYLNGDNMDNSLGTSAGGAAFAEQDMMPDVQRDTLEEVLRPIAHKTLNARKGNHEARSYKHALMDPLKEICGKLEIPYFPGPTNMDVFWRGYRWSFFLFHGTGGSNKPGGKLNAAGKPRQYNDFRHFFVMGHVHDELTQKVMRTMRFREFENQKLKRFWIEHLKEYIIVCPSYLLYDNTYAEEAGYSPGSRNTIVMRMFDNGDYHVVSSKRDQDGKTIIEQPV
jgi:hypothetical protein